MVPLEKHPNVKWAALKMMSMFGSTYVWESAFSTLKQVKSKHRSVLKRHPCKIIVSSCNYGIQARLEEDRLRQGISEAPLSSMLSKRKRYDKFLYFCLWALVEERMGCPFHFHFISSKEGGASVNSS